MDRPCPVCGTSAAAGPVLHEQRVDPALLDRFAFASRKLPELMHWRLVECPVCGLSFASPAPDAPAPASTYRDAGDSGEEARYAALTYRDLPRRAKRGLTAALDRARLGSLPVTLPAGNLVAVAWKRSSGMIAPRSPCSGLCWR